jgi:hypothetical protein
LGLDHGDVKPAECGVSKVAKLSAAGEHCPDGCGP